MFSRDEIIGTLSLGKRCPLQHRGDRQQNHRAPGGSDCPDFHPFFRHGPVSNPDQSPHAAFEAGTFFPPGLRSVSDERSDWNYLGPESVSHGNPCPGQGRIGGGHLLYQPGIRCDTGPLYQSGTLEQSQMDRCFSGAGGRFLLRL